nr:MAG TPA: hypothetical protein [Caudoviricetes sp.]
MLFCSPFVSYSLLLLGPNAIALLRATRRIVHISPAGRTRRFMLPKKT